MKKYLEITKGNDSFVVIVDEKVEKITLMDLFRFIVLELNKIYDFSIDDAGNSKIKNGDELITVLSTTKIGELPFNEVKMHDGDGDGVCRLTEIVIR